MLNTGVSDSSDATAITISSGEVVSFANETITDGNGSTGGVTVSDGLVKINTGTGSVAAVDFYCEVNNAHRVKLKAPAHSDFSGNVDVTLPNYTSTLIGTNSAGNVGIGRTPTAYGSFKVLDLAGSSGAIQKVIHTGNTVELQNYASSTVGAVGTATSHALVLTTADTERMRIDSNGTVQIGSNTAHAAGAAVLHLHQPDATSNAYLNITQQDGGSTSSDGMSIGMLDGGVNAVIRNRENGYLKFWTNNTARMTITNSGAVDIGGSEAAHANTDDLIVGNYSGNHGIQINAQNTGNSSIFFGDNDSVLIGQIEYVHGSDYFAFITGLGQRLRVDHHGVKFNSDTAQANALDDYEEGSFTPSLANTGLSPAPTGAGWYTKIGGLVHVQMYFAGISPTSAGNTRINGMPFAASTPGNAYAVCHYCHGTILGNNTNGGGYFTGTAIDVIAPGSTGYNSWATGGNKYGMWSGSYHTNS